MQHHSEGMGKADELEVKFDEIIGKLSEKTQTPWFNVSELRGLALLGKAVLRLDRSSSALFRVNIWLTVVNAFFGAVLIVIGIVQVFLMLRGR